MKHLLLEWDVFHRWCTKSLNTFLATKTNKIVSEKNSTSNNNWVKIMDALQTKVLDFKFLFDSLDEFNLHHIVAGCVSTLRSINWHLHIHCHPVAIIYIVCFLLYAYLHSVSILTQLTFTLIIYKCVNESMKSKHRYAVLRYSVYDLIKLITQIIGDVLVIPYCIAFEPCDRPCTFYQDTSNNETLWSHLQPIIHSYTPTFWHKNSLIQFLCICLDETPLLWFFQKSQFHMKRECITLSDGGLLALDWWVKPSSITQTDCSKRDGKPVDSADDDCKYSEETPSHFDFCRYSDKINHIEYKSKIYYQYHHKLYQDCFANPTVYPKGDDTPILLIFPTFAGDSVSAPTRLICRYFVAHNWRVIVYVKRGCGSFTKGEFLPLTNLKPFCLHGQEDYDVIIDLIQSRYPNAPKMLMGLSGGGALVQSILSNQKYKGQFCGGIKVDAGMDYNVECADLDQRQPLIANILGQFFDVAIMKCREHKLKHEILESDPYYKWFKWDDILTYNGGLKSFMWCLQKFVAPAHGFGDDVVRYLEWSKPGDLRKVHAPLLILDTWGDFMRNNEHILTDFSKQNENVFHVITTKGAHCIRREGLIGNRCWISRLTHSFAHFVVRQQIKV